ncbi:Centromere protein Cenp-I [Penicillium taxi]|uniref:Centromere protein Cenp-I n=1 Tax=Penicillium taxi TaxID=168475 RepID=UPI0025454A71|nr:Centromere protein Cenp-I [Penicillium taxi]KAJ5887666.1 Centromere protein Cenp-I [Penicillium taxi]
MDSSLTDAIEHLEATAFVPAKQRYTDVGKLVNTIASVAYENGIPQNMLGRILKILTVKNNLDQGTITILIKNLYPQERVASEHVNHIVCCLGPSKFKPSPATQALLVRWLILAYDLLQDRTHLGKLYAVLFNHLDMISLRKSLCHVLSMITRRKHVKPFRIQALMDLVQRNIGDEKEIISLLSTYKNYYPDIITGDVSGSRRSSLFFKHPDLDWSSHARMLQSQNMERVQATQGSSFQVLHRGAIKRSKIEVVVPVLQTSRVSKKHASLEEIRDISYFVENIDKIELPNQLISMLENGMAQKYLHLVQSKDANHRLDEWLKTFLKDQLEQIHDGQEDEPEVLSYILSLVLGYSIYTKKLLPPVRSFLESYLKIWNGRDNREQVLRLLQFIPIESYDSLRRNVFLPMESALLDVHLSSRTDLLDFYSSLIYEWSVELRTQPSISEESIPLSKVIKHAELLAATISELVPLDHMKAHEPVVSSILRFYKCLVNIFLHASKIGSIRLAVPPPTTIYTLVFIPNIFTISTLNSILAGYKLAFETSRASQLIPRPSYDPKIANQLNGYVMDVCNLLWRNRALNPEDDNAHGCLIPASSVTALTQHVRQVYEVARHYDRETAFNVTISTIFSLSHHAAFCNFSAACFEDIEEDQKISGQQSRLRKPVTQKALQALEQEGGAKITWQEYRVQMLNWLDAVGTRGTTELMRSTIKNLQK